MQYIYENALRSTDRSVSVRSEAVAINNFPTLIAHQHCEIALIEHCAGKRFIGDQIQDFAGTELVLLGSNLPHCWQYMQMVDPLVLPQAHFVDFFPDFLGKEFLAKQEARQLNRLLDKASSGLLFKEETAGLAKRILQEMQAESGLGRVALLLKLLDLLAHADQVQVLSSSSFNRPGNSGDAVKISKVFAYIHTHFQREISLKEVADIIPLSPPAFCRFFKAKTNATLTDIIKEVRIGHAAKLLLEGRHNVSEACFECGYNNISNFNKHFKEIKKMSPRTFIKQYEQQLMAV